MIKDRKRILYLIKFIPIGAVISISVVLLFISIIGINNYFNKEIKKAEITITNKEMSKSSQNVETMLEIMDNLSGIVVNSFKREIRVAVNLGYEFIENTYQQNRNLPKVEIIKKIKNSLRNFRFYNDRSGYYFIYSKTGKVVMLPIKKNLEGKNLIHYKDISGKCIIKDFLKNLQKKPEGVFDTWYYYKPKTNIMMKKLGFAEYNKHLDLMIGSAVYYKNINQEIKKRLIGVINNIKIVRNKNIAILNSKGIVLFNGSDNNKLNIDNMEKYNEIIKLAKKGLKQQVHKYKIGNQIFMYGYYKSLDLIVINRICLAELKNKVKHQKESIDKVVLLVLKQFLTASIIFIIFILIVTFHLTNLIKKIFDKYEKELIKEKDKAQKSARIKSEFLANMSHEIRTPLNAMFGFIKILQEKDTDEESKKYLNIVQKSGENLLTIINDILDFSKIEAGKFQIENIKFNPKEEIEVIHELFSTKASEKHILLEIKEDLKYNIISDPTRIKQVIANLLSNAIKFTSNNKKIILSLKYNEITEKLFVEIIDEGIGISKENLKTIFESFSQADNSTTRKYGGTGLGLTISYKLIKLLGGELKVESEEGKGSRFYFEIPAKKDSLITKTMKKSKSIENQNFNYHILVVEDNSANQMFMKVILKKLGVTFDIANNGLESLNKFQKNKYDLILMDENMPQMNGIEATKKIREIERMEHLDHTIITALTANALEGDKERFILAGMDYYLSKPLDIEKLKQLFVKLNETRIKR